MFQGAWLFLVWFWAASAWAIKLYSHCAHTTIQMPKWSWLSTLLLVGLIVTFIIQIPLKTFSHCNHLHRRNLVLVSHQSRLWGPRGRAGELFVHVRTSVKFIFVCYLNFRGSYGYSVWMVWIGGGCFLPAAALAFEGGFINEKGFNYAELMGWVNSWALLFILCFNKHLAIIKVIPVIRTERSTSVRG